ncbi:hypothetical protein DCAR_0206821 [Daucus carota subsp. sativus]|uniref:Cyclic nucleotide-binding domain-containing protein n=2 Tax=Daucus carota subsp. sativus TaxID=79200 RepID=A0A166DGI5_DAUCS|nr:hypothetical protein DCAR_0206821 [Daucus carota subsp. sativus]
MNARKNLHLEQSAKLLASIPKPSLLVYDRETTPWWKQILDPRSDMVRRWNYFFLLTSIGSLFLDPLYLLLPSVTAESVCISMDLAMRILLTFWRSVVDIFSIMHISMKFRLAYVAKDSKVFGRGELVMDPRSIAIRYLKTDFIFDLAASFPLPQILIWFVIPATTHNTASRDNHSLSLAIMLQYIPRIRSIFPLTRQILKTSGSLAQTSWAGAAYNLMLYVLASHVLGAVWYLLSVERQYACWKQECKKEWNGTHSPSCELSFLDCTIAEGPARDAWLQTTKLMTTCNPRGNSIDFQFGMFAEAFVEEVSSENFIPKLFYCLWWGLKNLSSYGQGLMTGTYKGENLFSSFICIAGLVLFALLIGNMQAYMQSTSARLEQWRVRRSDTEEWMRHRQLPEELQDRVRRFIQYQWLATRGVDEEEIVKSLPLDLKRGIQRHLCLALVRQVSFFSQLDDQLLDAICEHLVPSLNTKDTYIIREDDPVNEMLFIIRGQLESSTTNGGRSGFFNSITIKPGDFCGEELLTWALVPSSDHLPSSTRTVKCLTEVEAFALRAEDLKFVAKQFKRLHSKKIQHAFRYYSHQWRTWGTCFIQVAWRRYKRKVLTEELMKKESLYYKYMAESAKNHDFEGEQSEGSSKDHRNEQHLGATILASQFATNTRRGVDQKLARVNPDDPSLKMPKMFKPDEPDFSAGGYD